MKSYLQFIVIISDFALLFITKGDYNTKIKYGLRL